MLQIHPCVPTFRNRKVRCLILLLKSSIQSYDCFGIGCQPSQARQHALGWCLPRTLAQVGAVTLLRWLWQRAKSCVTVAGDVSDGIMRVPAPALPNSAQRPTRQLCALRRNLMCTWFAAFQALQVSSDASVTFTWVVQGGLKCQVQRRTET